MNDAGRWVLPSVHGLGELTDIVCAPLTDARVGKAWWVAIGLALAGTIVGAIAIGWSLAYGVGSWGNNTMVVWGFPIANYVWWIGIGNAGTLISSLLLLTRQKWRASINRFAEAMTLFAVSMAGIFPIIHLGRFMYFYWMAPYPATMGTWPQWRSALVWDFWAIVSYLLFSILFFYVGLVPDLATLRDRPGSHRRRRLYGAAALGWQGSARQWAAHGTTHRMLAAIATPLVCSVHSIVGLDFAASMMPGWAESIFPPYFVVGALFSGFAVVVLLAAIIREAMGLHAIIRPAHFDAMARVILAAAIVMTVSYATEWYQAWWSGDAAETRVVVFEFTGPYAWLYWLMLTGNCIAPQILWWPAMRRSLPMLCAVSVGVLIGMWLERILIILVTLSKGYQVSAWWIYAPTIVDFLILFGTLCAFCMLMLLFARIVPVVSIYETRELVAEARE